MKLREKGKEMEKDDMLLLQVKLPDNSLLILTQEEFERSRRRGDTVIQNRLSKDKTESFDSDVIQAEGVDCVKEENLFNK